MRPEYPLSEKQRDRLTSPSGLPYDGITLERALAGGVRMEDLRVTATTLELQAQIAEDAGRPQLAANLRRAAELVAIPEETILRVYNALRPGRADRAELLALAVELEENHQAPRCAALVREAAACGPGPGAGAPGQG